MTSVKDPNSEASFAETAMTLAGKTAEEATRTGAVDRADDQVESLFAEQYKTSNSPVHKAVWDAKVPLELFATPAATAESLTMPAMTKSLEVLRKHKRGGTMMDERGKVTDEVLADLAKTGYWGMLIEKEYGGQGANVRQFMSFLTQVATIEPTCAGLASVHGCIGAVDPLRAFGSDEQKKTPFAKTGFGRGPVRFRAD